jgi:hypothetical protein
MKRVRTIFLGALVASSAFAADQTAEFKKFLMSEQGAMTKAFQTKDISWFFKTSTPDFSEVMEGKTTQKKESLAGLKQWFDMMATIKVTSAELTSANAANDKGVAMVHEKMTGTMKPQKPHGKGSVMVMESWEKESWVKVKGKWMIQKIEEVKPTKMTIDGKPMKM